MLTFKRHSPLDLDANIHKETRTKEVAEFSQQTLTVATGTICCTIHVFCDAFVHVSTSVQRGYDKGKLGQREP